MSLRTKLLLAFTIVAILPLIAVAIYTRIQINRLGNELASVSRGRLIESARTDVGDDLRHVTALISARRSAAELLVFGQAREIEKLLMSAPDESSPLFSDADFDREDPRIEDLAPSERHARRNRDATTRPVLVSEKHLVFRPPPGKSISDVSALAAHMVSLADSLREIRDRSPDLVYWQYAVFSNGLQLAYPGHGGFPRQSDPRERAWYREAIARDGVVWSPPSVDPTTRRITLSVAAPFHSNSAPIGVTGIDVSLQSIIAETEIARWGQDARADMLIAGNAGENATIIATRANEGFGSRWSERAELQTLAAERPDDLASLLDAVRAGRPAMLMVDERGRRVLWAAMATGTANIAVLVRVPLDNILQPAIQLEQQFARVTAAHTQTVGVAIAVLLVALTLAVVASAQSLSRRIVAVSSAAKRVAQGELSITVPASGRDEVAELGQSFNTMIPQLQNRLNLMHSLNLAKEVQQSLLPECPPKLPGLDIAGTSIYCDETGGDYYDFLTVERLGPGQIVIAIGDVTGHGIAAAMLMATARALLRSRIEQPGSLADVFTDMNRHMINDRTIGQFMTLFCLIIDTQQRRLTWVSAGHDGVFGYSPSSATTSKLEGEDIPLAVVSSYAYHEASRDGWESGTVLVAGTDGIWESMNAKGESFGKDRLRTIIRENATRSADEISREIHDQVRQFRGDQPQMDDVTLVVIRLLN